MSEPIYKAEGRAAARRAGIESRIDWELTTAPERLAVLAAESDILLWLSPELQGGHRLLLIEGLAAGKLTVVPDCPLYDDLPAGAVAKLELGRALGPSLAMLLRALLAGDGLREGRFGNEAGGGLHDARAGAGGGLGEGLVANGCELAAACPRPAAAAAILIAELERIAAHGGFPEAPVSQPTWDRVDREIVAATSPGGASPAVREAIVARLRARTRPGRR